MPGEDEHQQWVVCEGVCATVAVRRAMLDDGHRIDEVEHFEHCYRSFVDYIHDYLIAQPGRWIRRLGPHNESVQPAKSSRWDVYHAIQAMLAIRVPLWPPTAPRSRAASSTTPRSRHPTRSPGTSSACEADSCDWDRTRGACTPGPPLGVRCAVSAGAIPQMWCALDPVSPSAAGRAVPVPVPSASRV